MLTVSRSIRRTAWQSDPSLGTLSDREPRFFRRQRCGLGLSRRGADDKLGRYFQGRVLADKIEPTRLGLGRLDDSL